MGVAIEFLKKQSGKINKRYLLPIPFFFTFANALMGLVSVFYALEKDLVVAAYCILIAAVFDMLDGRIARALGVESMIGVALDSLCDAISFCFAPAILLYSWKLHSAYVGKAAIAFYLCAGLYRLAKFNVVGFSNQSYFTGLPTTAAAVFFSNLVLFQLAMQSSWHVWLPDVFLVILIVAVSVLMLSAIPFATCKGKITRRFLWSICIGATIVFVASFWYEYPLLLFLLSGYILLHVGRYLCTFRL